MKISLVLLLFLSSSPVLAAIPASDTANLARATDSKLRVDFENFAKANLNGYQSWTHDLRQRLEVQAEVIPANSEIRNQVSKLERAETKAALAFEKLKSAPDSDFTFAKEDLNGALLDLQDIADQTRRMLISRDLDLPGSN
jgi:Tfp pilus assembly protein PilO